MNQLYDQLLKEKQYLSELKRKIKESVDNAPKGQLRISRCGKSVQYYHKTKENKESCSQGKYIKKQDVQLARDIAQRDYDIEILNIVQDRLKIIEKLLSLYQENTIEQAYEKLNSYRKDIVIPRVLSEEIYVKMWEEIKYIGKSFEQGTAVISSNRGERVRSKSEKIIADMLEKNKIPYRYEAPVIMSGLGTIYPDFTVLNRKRRKEIYWEHFGMMDNKEYCENALKRIEIYQRNGFLLGDRLIITYETTKYPLETILIERNIREYCLH